MIKAKSTVVSAVAGALLALTGSIAHASTAYSALGDFALTNPNGVWSYGTGDGPTQTLFQNDYLSCFGASNFECMNNATNADVPGVGKVTSGASAELVGTVLVPDTVLWMHPGSSGPDVSVEFTAPSAGEYSVSGFFERLSTADSGNGVLVSIYANGVSIYSGSLTTLVYGTEDMFNQDVTLAAGEALTFAVNNNGDYTFDSTGLSASVSAVPEPGAWALMLSGIMLAGAALRSRRDRGVERSAAI